MQSAIKVGIINVVQFISLVLGTAGNTEEFYPQAGAEGDFRRTTTLSGYPVNRSESPPSQTESHENWWDYCPICNSKLINLKCKYVCPNPKCNFFMSCSEFDR
jgi:hypothetical protein